MNVVCLLQSTYHDRLHPHTEAIYDDPLNITWESGEYEELNESKDASALEPAPNPFNITKSKSKEQSESKEEELCQIYDTIQHDFVKDYMCPYLVTMSIKNGAFRKRKQRNDELVFDPQIDDKLRELQKINKNHLCDTAEQFQQHHIEGNFDCPTSRAWLEYYQEFISTVCINEHHRQRKGGSQYRQGREIRRSTRGRNSNNFEHILTGWLQDDHCETIVEKWKNSFNGMGWKADTLPLL